MRVLFVCTGNTCRSPFAAAVARNKGHLDADSAGLAAHAGDEPPVDAIAVARELGYDLSAHRARVLDEEMLDRADVVVAMTRAHLGALEKIGKPRKARLLADVDVDDPIGHGPAAYRRAYAQIESGVRELFEVAT